MSHREEASGKTQDTLEKTMSLGWPGNASGSPRKSWRKCLGVGMDSSLADGMAACSHSKPQQCCMECRRVKVE
ncbi:hypothetical protein L3Q82_001143 [Scortum barcoo]|uniref:Uncharacterized protein n=1 Tax=Scortum barcoo TaxID=214431 RepID=A0ACB8WAQ7_9TELE|nr:hypothetical protein L3Q82_001143 [Scortum barcoo]